MDEPDSYAVVVLAAGASTRMGQPKQLLPVDRQPLLRRVVHAALESKLGQVYVVLGAYAEKIRSSLNGLPVDVVVNDEWSDGMGSSIRCAMTAITRASEAVAGVIVTLGDQPGIPAGHLTRLARMRQEARKSIVASRYEGRLTPPVLFAANHFPALRALHGDAGAKALLQSSPQEMAVVETDGLGDLDTPQDYAAFLKMRA
jgi:molybdenum cofactor cytidylyltransferase